jgi:thiol-disulfide isomerase/thioredoxin
MAADFTRYDAAGNAVRLSGFKGKVVLLNFWATWCGGCKMEIPWFIEFQRTYGNRNFVVLGVSLDEDGWKSVKPFIEQKKIDYPVVIGDDKIAALDDAGHRQVRPHSIRPCRPAEEERLRERDQHAAQVMVPSNTPAVYT